MTPKKKPTPRKTPARRAATVAAQTPAEPNPPVWHKSATIRLVLGTIALTLLWQGAKAYGESPWPLVRPWLAGEDGLYVKSVFFKLTFALLALTLWWQYQLSRLRSNGLNFRKDIWPVLVTNPVAVAIWLAAGVVGSAMLIGSAV